MRYLGGKFKQSKQIREYVSCIWIKPSSYHEPFCGSLASGMAIGTLFPDIPVHLSDANPYLICFWQGAQNGFDPPATITETDYKRYNTDRPINDPMTAYIGFACSFGGKFFGGPARTDGVIRPSWKNTLERIRWIRTHDVRLSCCPYWDHDFGDDTQLVYLDPPYIGRTPQSRVVPAFDREHFVRFAESLSGVVLASEFINDAGWDVVHNWGDTVVRHLNAKPADGTTEILMRVK